MALHQAPVNRSRNVVAWFGTSPPADAKDFAKAWRLEVRPLTDADLELHNMTTLALVVFDCNPASWPTVRARLKADAESLLNLDCRISLRIDPAVRSEVLDMLDELKLPVALAGKEAARFRWQVAGDPSYPNISVFNESQGLADLVRPALESPPLELPPGKVGIQADSHIQLSVTDKALIERAFHDCSSVYLASMPGGRSGVETLRAFPERLGGPGRWPQTVFIKIGSRHQIQREYESYIRCVEPYLSFDLGPHLIPSRCFLGAKRAILVGNFVDEAEPLAVCIRSGRAAPAIACLFDRTLLGWHRGAKVELQEHSLGQILYSRLVREKVAEQRLTLAMSWGATLKYRELCKRLLQCESKNVLMGHAHGDLHVGNVLVREGNAVLIDFAACADRRPLLRDAAALEASLLTDVLAEEDYVSPLKLLAEIEFMYRNPLMTVPPIPRPRSPIGWFASCVRQIRMYASRLEVEPGQYAASLAAALLFKATKDSAASGHDANVRAMAYALAERILVPASRTVEVV